MDRIGSEIERELRRGGSADAVPLAAITAIWPEAVGAVVARQAWPLRLGRGGTLHVATSSATWANELDLLQSEVLEGLRERLGAAAPTDLRFAVGPIPEPAPEPAGLPPPAAPVPPEIELEASAVAAAIDDPELRDLVSRAARASLVKTRSGRDF